MKKKVYLPLVFIFCLFLSACDTLKPVGNITQEAINLNYYWMEGSIINFVDTANLTEEESLTIIKAITSAESVRQALIDYYGDPEKIVKDLPKIQLNYLSLRYHYIEVREIIINHKDDYSKEAWDLFTAFDSHANKLDDNFNELRNSVNTNATGLQVLSTVSTLVKLIAIL